MYTVLIKVKVLVYSIEVLTRLLTLNPAASLFNSKPSEPPQGHTSPAGQSAWHFIICIGLQLSLLPPQILPHSVGRDNQ